MAVPSFPDGLTARGTVNLAGADNVALPGGTVTDAGVASSTKIDADKLQHLHKPGADFGLAIGDTVTDEERIVHVVSGTSGKLRGFHAKLNAAATTGTTSFDLKVNGSSVLTATVDITSSEGTNVQDGTIAGGSESLSVDDVVSIEMSNSSGDGTGPFAWVEIEENAE